LDYGIQFKLSESTYSKFRLIKTQLCLDTEGSRITNEVVFSLAADYIINDLDRFIHECIELPEKKLDLSKIQKDRLLMRKENII